jgi:hypothetical protein
VAGSSLLDEIVRDGARQMLAMAALQVEVAAYIDAHGQRSSGRPPAGGAVRQRLSR